MNTLFSGLLDLDNIINKVIHSDHLTIKIIIGLCSDPSGR